MKKIKTLLFTLLLMLPALVHAQEEQQVAVKDTIDRMAEDFVNVSICIAEPTDSEDDGLGVLGHSFIRLQCKTFDLDYIFSYESENTNDMQFNLTSNEIRMSLLRINTDEYLEVYRRWHRAVHEYHLNLPPQVETELWRVMDETVERDQDRDFDLMRRGCTQTLVQFVEKALATDHKQITYGAWPEEYKLSRRKILFHQFAAYPWMRFLYGDLLCDNDFNDDIAPERKIVYPAQIAECWQRAQVDGNQLATYLGDIVEAPLVTPEQPQFTPLMMAIVLLLLAIGFALWRKPWFDWVMLGMQFLAGLLLCWLALCTNLPGAKEANLLWLYCPLTLILWHWRRYWAMAYTIVLALWAMAMIFIPHLFVDPAHIVICLAYIVMYAKIWIVSRSSHAA